MTTPCYGKHELFDSTDRADHLAARKLCATCPVLMACARHLADLKATAGAYGQPEGTWAGRLVTDTAHPYNGEANQRRLTRFDERHYTLESARNANQAWKRGDRSEWAETGRRVYNRWSKRRNREAS